MTRREERYREYKAIIRRLQTVIDVELGERPVVQVLEAGCGSSTMIRMPPGARVTGLDASRRQLERNQLLDERLHGDLETYPLPRATYDLIVCWDVLEHLLRPMRACENLWNALAPGGLMVLGFPNVRAFKSVVARWTPHWFHVWFYRSVSGRAGAGTDDLGPFPTYLRGSMTPAAIVDFIESRGGRS